MHIDNLVRQLCEELNLTLPVCQPDGQWSLVFEPTLTVSLTASQLGYVASTSGFTKPKREQQWQEAAVWGLHQSFAWLGNYLSLTTEGDDELVVQSLLPEGLAYSTFFEALSAHCCFCENLKQFLITPSTTEIAFYGAIRP